MCPISQMLQEGCEKVLDSANRGFDTEEQQQTEDRIMAKASPTNKQIKCCTAGLGNNQPDRTQGGPSRGEMDLKK